MAQSKDRLKEIIKRLESVISDQSLQKLWVRLALSHYTFGICYYQLRDFSNGKAELLKSYKIIQAKGGVSEIVMAHIEKMIKVGPGRI